MGGEIDWSALETVVELLAVQDVTELIYSLVAIRDHQARQNEDR